MSVSLLLEERKLPEKQPPEESTGVSLAPRISDAPPRHSVRRSRECIGPANQDVSSSKDCFAPNGKCHCNAQMSLN